MLTLIKNGNVVTSSETFVSDILIEDEIIKAIGKFDEKIADVVIDATGKYVMPGAIDAHTHMELRQSEKFTSVDDFYTGTVAAACGGTTTIIDHIAFGPAGCNLHYSIDRYKELAEKSAIDYSFHGVIQHVDDEIIKELENIVENEGIISFKAYSTYGFPTTDEGFYRILQSMKKTGGVLTVHCENHEITNYLQKKFVQEGKTEPIYHALSRPNNAESETVGRLIQLSELADDSNLYIVHTSAKESIDQIKLAREKGLKNLKVETCPQYLLLTDDCYKKENDEGLKYMMAPPLRKKEDNEVLWTALQDGTVDVIATDHCPFYFSEKLEGKGNFTKAPGGAPGVEERVRLIFTYGVCKNKISVNKFVELMCENPARIFGMYPQKGTIMPNADADIMIIDDKVSEKLKQVNLHSACDYTPYEDFEVSCKIDCVLSRGKIVYQDGHFKGEKGYGKFVHRKPVK
ncbi:dihydropyrimidinase [Peptoanaerobacter stomatis]|uniref:Dihydropyrimidinase n=1 Tax=Peptoanaerobacter stomatis TaxID=796937 RepID=J5US14_9FIRM|nr:dihydropyrimidinase [Peptoanaerobacter stomatis]EJU24659.1 dihydropyrimidinase [Peptoanaerobacter stomatis]